MNNNYFIGIDIQMLTKNYEPNWSSLKRHRSPEWLDNAKFGIYFHWGIYSVPAFYNEWYPHVMYNRLHKISKYHKEHYGDPSEFGYKDFIPNSEVKNSILMNGLKFVKKLEPNLSVLLQNIMMVFQCGTAKSINGMLKIWDQREI